jgi:glutamate formiminotransferase
VNFQGSLEEARRVAREVRAPDVRALGFELLSRKLMQISMNLVNPSITGPAVAFARVTQALTHEVVDCEVVGLVPDGVLDELAGLPLRTPARSVEQAIGRGFRDSGR